MDCSFGKLDFINPKLHYAAIDPRRQKGKNIPKTSLFEGQKRRPSSQKEVHLLTPGAAGCYNPSACAVSSIGRAGAF
jgi:hypothetical protein